ncbi:MAG: hypothetical protein HQL30_07355 [Candidatus Omnitrophica bacterium]|nr:hypothetical protein [Candidatus Omnitrophota bacterium]
MLRKKFKTVVLSCFFAVQVVSRVGAGEVPEGKPEYMPDFSASSAFVTKYIWRGQNLGNEPVMQSDISMALKGFTVGWWSNYSMNNDKTRDAGRYQEFTESDLYLDYTVSVGTMSETFNVDSPDVLDKLSFSAGYTYYTFPNLNWDLETFDTHEPYLGVSYDILLKPFFKWYWDVDSGKGIAGDSGRGSYYLAGIGHTFEFGESGISADLGLTAAYNDEQWTDKSGWSDLNLSGGVNITCFKYFTIRPLVSYSMILDRDTYNDLQDNEIYGGIKIGVKY